MRRLEQNRILKKKAVAYLGGKCEKCGYTGVALTFHHKDPEEKEFTFGSFVDKPWAKVVKELDKCQLLCFNCHMEIHWEEAGSESV
jgi:predicted HNH restriction endonuclease